MIVQLIDWSNHYDVITAAVIFDQNNGYDVLTSIAGLE